MPLTKPAPGPQGHPRPVRAGWRGPQWEVVLAASVIATVPVPMLIIFFVGQRSFVEGIATTGRKG